MDRTAEPARDLLFGLIALQNGLIEQGALFNAFNTWSRAGGRPMAEVLLGQGALDADDRTAVEALVVRHLRRHGGDPGKSLAALRVERSTRQGLAGVGPASPGVEETLARLGPVPDGDRDGRAARTARPPPGRDGRRRRDPRGGP